MIPSSVLLLTCSTVLDRSFSSQSFLQNLAALFAEEDMPIMEGHESCWHAVNYLHLYAATMYTALLKQYQCPINQCSSPLQASPNCNFSPCIANLCYMPPEHPHYQWNITKCGKLLSCWWFYGQLKPAMGMVLDKEGLWFGELGGSVGLRYGHKSEAVRVWHLWVTI